MSDTIGRITVPSIPASGLTFPLVSEFGNGYSQSWPVVVHRFGQSDAKSEQRYRIGIGPKKHAFKRTHLSFVSRNSLASFWESLNGPYKSFTYNVPNADQSTTPTTVVWEQTPLGLTYLVNACQVGFNFIEVPTSTPAYSIASTVLRFPSAGLQSALLGQVQQIIPLVHIRPRESAVPDIYLSDRRCTVGGQLYLPRVLGIGDPGGDVLITQDLKGAADNVTFQFGNADRVMTLLANDTDLKYATIDLCLYHVNTGILLQLWKGFIQAYTSDGSPVFTVNCSDGVFQTTQQYPARTVSRQCWKTFNDGLNCPYATHGSGGNPTSCDYYWNSANGCLSHGMGLYFGGIPALPQSASVKDNSTGFIGFGRNTVTATSIISDTMWGQALPEIWCNQQSSAVNAFMTNAIIAAVRDNGDFFDVLGIVGAGPLGSYSIVGNFAGEFVTNADGFTYLVAPMADGFPAQGLKIANNGVSTSKNSALGLRQVVGNDPIPSGDASAEQFGLANIVGQNAPPLPQAAGTAFVELLYPKPSGFSPSPADSHSLSIPIAQGMSGRKWAIDGSSSWVSGLINPIWIAVNSHLRAVGLPPSQSDSAGQIAAQLAQFSLPDVVAAAAICDTLVTPILGTGTELQFQFQGVVGTQRPFRDWLTQILSCCLGWYSFQYGQLKLGLRINASAVDAYGIGNILYQSLALQPTDAAFERLIVSYADVAYQYQKNTAEYVDKTHAALYGSSNSPKTVRQNIVGCSTLSQGLRLAATRVREEIGGVNAAEWRNARKAVWKTTLLGLNNDIGQVVSMTHPDVPGLRGTCNISGGAITYASGDAFDTSMLNKVILLGTSQYVVTTVNVDGSGNVTSIACTPTPGNASGVSFRVITADLRIQRWSLNKDFSVSIQAQTVTPSMYNLDVGPDPADVPPLPIPNYAYPVPTDLVWGPNQVQYLSTDALFPSEYTFELRQFYTALADGTLASVRVKGKTPVNGTVPNATQVGIGGFTIASTGGTIPGGILLRVAVVAFDSLDRPTLSSGVYLVNVPTGTNTNAITITGITWPAMTGLSYCKVFASIYDDTICDQGSTSLTVAGSTYTPSTVTLNSLVRGTVTIPSTALSGMRVKAKKVSHSGVIGARVSSIPSGHIVSSDMVDTTGGTFTPVGRVISIIGRSDYSTPLFNGTITSWDPSTGTMGVTPDPVGHVGVGDILIVRFLGSDNSSNPTSIDDPGLLNATYNANGSYGGNVVNGEIGLLFRVIAGTSRGAIRKITSNTTTGYTWDLPLALDATSVWIIESPTWDYSGDPTEVDNASLNSVSTLDLPIDNFRYVTLLVSAFTIDSDGNESTDGDQPVREVWIYGQLYGMSLSASTGAGSFSAVTISGSNVTLDLGASSSFYVTLGSTPYNFVVPIASAGTLSPEMEFTLHLISPASPPAGGCPPPTFASGVGGFVAGTAGQISIDPTGNTMTICKFKSIPGLYWVLSTPPNAGVALS